MFVNSPTDWDDAYANRAHVKGSEALPDQWTNLAKAYRESGISISQDISYGAHSREQMDIVWPDETQVGQPHGLVVFVHGGYWMAMDKSYWTHLAEGARRQGWAVCLPSYVLAPEARIHSITRQIGRAIEVAANKVDGPIRLAGHSAGGHLVTRMLCQDSPLTESVANRIVHTLSISGVHDLRPLMWTKMNETLQLDEAEANQESPVLLRPKSASCLSAWVGSEERPEFIRQAELLTLMWRGLDTRVALKVQSDHNHFSIIEGLADANSEICQALLI